MDSNEVKIIKQIGNGFEGNVYLAKFNGQNVACKISRLESIDRDQPLKLIYYRQLYFNEKVAKYYPNHFLTILGHGLVNQSLNNDICKECNKLKETEINVYKHLPECYFTLHKVLDGTMNDVWDNIAGNKVLFKDMIYQIIDSINILKNAGFCINDRIKMDNYMYTIKPNGKYNWFLIDYILVVHKNFKINKNLHWSQDPTKFQLNGDYKGFLFCILYNYMTPEMAAVFNKYKIIKLDIYTKTKTINESLFKFLSTQKNAKMIYKHINYIIGEFGKIYYYVFSFLYPQLFLEFVGVPAGEARAFKENHPYKKLFLYLIAHRNDKTYTEVLKNIHKF